MKNKILEIDRNNRSNKIFGIGLPKTGTTSLNTALNILGLKSVHSPRQYTISQCLGIPMYRWEYVVSTDFKDKKLRDILLPFDNFLKKDLKFNEWDAITNFGEHIYSSLDEKFPNSKFILTIRNKEDWLKSIHNFVDIWGNIYGNSIIDLIRKLHIFHYVNFNEEYFSLLYDNHLRNIKYYFRNRSEDLLIINICEGEGWEKLCPFLNKNIINISFPYENETKN